MLAGFRSKISGLICQITIFVKKEVNILYSIDKDHMLLCVIKQECVTGWNRAHILCLTFDSLSMGYKFFHVIVQNL